MNGRNQLQAVLVSNDAKTLCLMDRALDPFQFKTAVFAQHDKALEYLESNFTDVVIFDWTKHEESGAFARRLREMSRRQVLMCIANSTTAMHDALGTGAHFVSHPPDSVDQITALLRAASSLILYNRRQNFRLEVSVEAEVRAMDRDLGVGTIVNLSENGLCVALARAIKINETLAISFKLPNGSPISASVRICWSKDDRAGAEFVSIQATHKAVLKEWLEQQFAERLVKWNPAWKFTTTKPESERRLLPTA
jgi:ActR/RegA family two-component response regulator